MNSYEIHPDWIREYGAHTATVLAYLVQQQAGADTDGWFAAPHSQLWEATRIRPETFLNARKKLEEAGLLETDRVSPFQNRYRLTMETQP